MADVFLQRPAGADGVAVVVLNAPERRNSLTLKLAHDLVEICDTIDCDPSIGAVVLRANGPAFCAGADRNVLSEVAAAPSSDRSYRALTAIYESFSRIARLAPPTLTAVQGTAVGAGLNLALSSDVSLVTESTRMVAGFLPLGVHPGGGHFTLTSRRCGPQIAAALALFGAEFVGTECVRAGLAYQMVPEAELEQRAISLARVAGADPELARLSADSYRLQAYPGLTQSVGARMEHAAQMWSFGRGTMTPSGKRHNDQS
ncbi:MAG: enoyl-CoA hydratase/isomerase family protein [Acidimicrobiia bacterium]